MNRFSLFSFYLLSVIFFTSCEQGENFKVTGNFTSATDTTLFLEHRGLGGIELLDSAKLKENGKFSFKQPAPENPEFYQLRIGEQIVVFAVDSNETVQVSGDVKDLFNTFKVDNSPVNDQIKQVDVLTQSAKKQIDELEAQHTDKTINDMQYLEMLDSVLIDYKEKLSKTILGNPSGAAAYYAAFQKINDYLIFDPHDKKDYAMYGAVATSWDKYYPGTVRSKHLYDFTMNALRARKQQEQQAAMLKNIPAVQESALPDIVLSDINGQKVALSSLQGKVVLLDFTVYNSEFSPKHNIELNSVYKKFASQNFEIYQISLDSEEHFWKNAANNLPWITVRDAKSVYSSLLSTYNVRELPTAFIVNREGDVVARIENYSPLEEELRKVL